MHQNWPPFQYPFVDLSQLLYRLKMFITVRSGNDERLIFNPDCHVANLLDNMKQRFNIENIEYTHLDLCDESGIAKDLPKYLRAYGSRLLTSPGTYVLVERRRYPTAVEESGNVEAESEENRPMETVYTSLLKNADVLIPGFLPRAPVLKTQNPKELRKGKQGKDLSKKNRVASPGPAMKSTSSLKLKPGSNKGGKGGRGRK